MSLTVVIAHTPEIPERRDMLQRQLLALEFADVIVHEVPILPGTPRARHLWTALLPVYRAAARLHTSHVALLSDDMLPAKGFVSAVDDIIRALPNELVCLFSMRKIQRAAYYRSDAYFTQPCGIWGGTLMLPVPLLHTFLRWEERCIPPEYRHDDGRVNRWVRLQGRTVWVTAPSLVQHMAPGNSLLGNSRKNRVAQVFLPDVEGVSFLHVPSKPLHDADCGKIDRSIAQMFSEDSPCRCRS